MTASRSLLVLALLAPLTAHAAIDLDDDDGGDGGGDGGGDDTGGDAGPIWSKTYVDYNQTVTSEISRGAGCYVSNGYKNFILDGETIDVFKNSAGVPVCSTLGYECVDGELESRAVTGCVVERAVFDCQVSGNNAGCSRYASCPGSRRIVAAVGACNLEAAGSVSDSLLANVAVGVLSVLRASDDVSAGRCWIGSTSLRSGSTKIATPFGALGTNVGCDEQDANGGDCHIRGALYCRWARQAVRARRRTRSHSAVPRASSRY